MKYLSKKTADMSFSTTKMVRVVISGAKKSSSSQEKVFSFLWLIGAFLITIVYIVIPLLIALRQIPNILLEIVAAALLLLVAELIVSRVLLKIARPTPTPSLLPKRYQPKQPDLRPSQPVQVKMPHISHASPFFRLPLTPSMPFLQFSKTSASHSFEISSLPTINLNEADLNTPIPLPQKLKLPSRS